MPIPDRGNPADFARAAMPVTLPMSRGVEIVENTVTVSAVCPGGVARHYRVQVQSNPGEPWRSVKSCSAARAAQEDAAAWAKRGCRVRVIGYRTSPTAA